jgi:hypothetical protein
VSPAKTAVIGSIHLMAFLALQNVTKHVQVEKFLGLHLVLIRLCSSKPGTNPMKIACGCRPVNQQENKLVLCSPVPYSPILCSPMQRSFFPLAEIVLRCAIGIGNQVAVSSK